MSKARTLADKATNGRKSFIINGDFDIWQRGVNQTSGGYGSDDRWFNGHAGSPKTHSRQAFVLGQLDVPGNPKYHSRTVVASVAGASNYVMKQQKIEGAATLSGETITLSFYAKADAPKNIAIEFTQNFGTGGAPSASVPSIGVQLVPITDVFLRYEVTVELPSVAGKTIGTDGNDYLAITFWFDSGSAFDSRSANLGQQSGTFDIAQVQLEKGSVATDFEYRSIGEERALCQRYYWRGEADGSGISFMPKSSGNNTAVLACGGSFPVTMRTTPATSLVTSPTYTNCTNNALTASETGFQHRVDAETTSLAYRASQGVYAADAEL